MLAKDLQENTATGFINFRKYKIEDVVSCLDPANFVQDGDGHSSSRRPIRFVFMGDSRMRQQFYNFLKVYKNTIYYNINFILITIILNIIQFIPDYDQNVELGEKSLQLEQMVDLHVDRMVSSRVLNLQVSFLWRPFLNDQFHSTIQQWALSFNNSRPNFLLTGLYRPNFFIEFHIF